MLDSCGFYPINRITSGNSIESLKSIDRVDNLIDSKALAIMPDGFKPSIPTEKGYRFIGLWPCLSDSTETVIVRATTFFENSC